MIKTELRKVNRIVAVEEMVTTHYCDICQTMETTQNCHVCGADLCKDCAKYLHIDIDQSFRFCPEHFKTLAPLVDRRSGLFKQIHEIENEIEVILQNP